MDVKKQDSMFLQKRENKDRVYASLLMQHTELSLQLYERQRLLEQICQDIPGIKERVCEQYPALGYRAQLLSGVTHLLL